MTAAKKSGKLVRLAVIGPGGQATGTGCGRGMYLMQTALAFPGVEVTAVYDLIEDNVKQNVEYVRKVAGNTPAGYCKGADPYKDLLARDDVDAVVIAATAQMHAKMAAEALLAGKHVASEVPGGYNMDELWELVEAKEKSGKRYVLLENYIYLRQNMMVLNMARKGVFGEPYVGECSYLHDCRSFAFHPDGRPTWREEWYRSMIGNTYSTHSLGPLAKWFGINDGDRLTESVSMMTEPRVMHEYAVNRFGPKSTQAKFKYKCGEFIRTMIQTAKGGVITVDFDLASPRPMECYLMIQGNKGIYNSRYNGVALGKNTGSWQNVGEYAAQYDHPCWKKYGEKADKCGGSDFFTIREFLRSVREDREPWLDVYDSCTWSAIFDVSRQSILKKGAVVEVPDFTRGKWKKADWRKNNIKPA